MNGTRTEGLFRNQIAVVENESILLNFQKIRKALLRLRALHHNHRSRLIGLLQDNGPMTVTELYIALRWEQSITSQHLSVLRVSGAVKAEREGKQIFYSLNQSHVRETMRLAYQLAEGYREYHD